MPFSTLLFVCGFLPVFLAVYWAAPARLKNAVALTFSILFYAWGAPTFLPVVLALGIADYFLGHGIGRATRPGAKKAWLVLGVTMHLGTLCYFKYSNFFVEQTNGVLGLLPGQLQLNWAHVILPIGISFITFEEISYLVDVYRGDAKPARSLPHYLLFLMLFPHSIAGPIFRWKDLEQQLLARNHAASDLWAGFVRFSLGLAKKILIANPVAMAADPIFALPSDQLTPSLAWLGAFAYTLQIYFDFSGYSDMAIGLGRMAGFKFKENFNQPYVSASITEFWRRWHISLSTWLRDYLYIPLGGNRGSASRTHLNIFLVFFLSGFWHGANWTFLIWGAYHGLLVLAEKWGPVASLKRALPKVVNVPVSLVLVLIGWVFFRAESLGGALHMLSAMFGFPAAQAGPAPMMAEYLSTRTAVTLVLGLVIAWLPLARRGGASIEPPAPGAPVRPIYAWALSPVVLVLAIAFMANSKFSPLIYFKF